MLVVIPAAAIAACCMLHRWHTTSFPLATGRSQQAMHLACRTSASSRQHNNVSDSRYAARVSCFCTAPRPRRGMLQAAQDVQRPAEPLEPQPAAAAQHGSQHARPSSSAGQLQQQLTAAQAQLARLHAENERLMEWGNKLRAAQHRLSMASAPQPAPACLRPTLPWGQAASQQPGQQCFTHHPGWGLQQRAHHAPQCSMTLKHSAQASGCSCRNNNGVHHQPHQPTKAAAESSPPSFCRDQHTSSAPQAAPPPVVAESMRPPEQVC